MNTHPMILCTHDESLKKSWKALSEHGPIAFAKSLGGIPRIPNALVWLDADLPNRPELTAANWSDRVAGQRWILASASPNNEQGTQAFTAGFMGYAHLYSPPDLMAEIFKTVDAGSLWVGQSLLSYILLRTRSALTTLPPSTTSGAWAEHLTDREREVAQRAALGESNHQIAEACGITERTVKAHLSAAFEKLGVHDRLQLSLKVHGIR